MKIKSLLGMKVLDTNANEVGKINDVEFDIENGKIDDLTISLKKNLLDKNNDIIVKYDNVKNIGDYVLLDIDIAEE
ncbi:PRC-barrel domain-containing protein [uncultured Methanobrevibacter sp.]|uniref:PRC-barrel domain-containing protein n=1 Tax=uncultured Methanobrevibacter sp. TaxID=253161 RepID=UPI0025E93C4A|nr:PRC-barrel domain-containing protein [uncultured Methanobrevibacter sp.]